MFSSAAVGRESQKNFHFAGLGFAKYLAYCHQITGCCVFGALYTPNLSPQCHGLPYEFWLHEGSCALLLIYMSNRAQRVGVLCSQCGIWTHDPRFLSYYLRDRWVYCTFPFIIFLTLSSCNLGQVSGAPARDPRGPEVDAHVWDSPQNIKLEDDACNQSRKKVLLERPTFDLRIVLVLWKPYSIFLGYSDFTKVALWVI